MARKRQQEEVEEGSESEEEEEEVTKPVLKGPIGRGGDGHVYYRSAKLLTQQPWGGNGGAADALSLGGHSSCTCRVIWVLGH
jgi:GTPase involved in cell partitioning and DNA repair